MIEKDDNPNREDGKYDPYTIKNIKRLLSDILRAARLSGYLQHNPCEKIELPKTNKREKQVYELEEALLLIRTVEAQHGSVWALFFKTAVFTGLRLGELLGLQESDFDWKANDVSVKRSYAATLRAKEPKTESGKRKVKLDPFLTADLLKARHLKEYFFSDKDGKPLSRKIIGQFLEQAQEAAKLKQLNFHCLRHTNVALRLAAGQDIYYISRQLGHKDIKTTLNEYWASA